MDFNDLPSRLRRLYSSIGLKVDENVQKYIKITEIDAGKMITFENGRTLSETENVILVIIEQIAKLKDHLINKSLNRQNVENAINDSFDLQIIMDLYNSEKHGYPLTKYRRSELDPCIKNVRNVLVLPPGEGFGININKVELVKLKGCRIMAVADVYDGTGNLICGSDKLINSGVCQWEEFIEKNNFIQ